jgi:hypothetical protein
MKYTTNTAEIEEKGRKWAAEADFRVMSFHGLLVA